MELEHLELRTDFESSAEFAYGDSEQHRHAWVVTGIDEINGTRQSFPEGQRVEGVLVGGGSHNGNPVDEGSEFVTCFRETSVSWSAQSSLGQARGSVPGGRMTNGQACSHDGSDKVLNDLRARIAATPSRQAANTKRIRERL